MSFSGAVVGSVGSVPFQIVPCSSLYLFLRSIGPLQCMLLLLLPLSQSCPTLCDPINGSPPAGDSPGKNTGVGCHFLLQCMKVKVKSLSRVRLLAAPRTVAYQAPPSMGFPRQEYWSGLPLPSPLQHIVSVD